MNPYDAELVRSLLHAAGFALTDEKEWADVILLNTCAIRENAHNKVYGHLARLQPLKRRRNLVVGVLGCMAQNLKEELIETKSIVDVLVGPDGYRRLPALILQAIEAQENGLKRKGLAVDLSEDETYDDILPERTEGVNGWIAVMRGLITSVRSVSYRTREGASGRAIHKAFSGKSNTLRRTATNRLRCWDRT